MAQREGCRDLGLRVFEELGELNEINTERAIVVVRVGTDPTDAAGDDGLFRNIAMLRRSQGWPASAVQMRRSRPRSVVSSRQSSYCSTIRTKRADVKLARDDVRSNTGPKGTNEGDLAFGSRNGRANRGCLAGKKTNNRFLILGGRQRDS